MPVFPSSVPQPQNCTSISNQGSLVLVGALDACGDEPTVITLTNTASVAVGDQVIILSNNAVAASSNYLRKGAVLTFGAVKVVVTANTLLTGGAGTTSVPIEPATATIASNATATSWFLQKLLAPQSVPINEESSTTDISDLTNGLQGTETVVKLMLNPQIQIINRFDDRAYNDIISKAAKVGGLVYVVFALSDTSHVFGRAVVSGNNREFTQMDVQKPSFTLLMQSPWYSYSAFAYESAANKTLINQARVLANLNPLV
jgi:hypothetical protein